MGSAHLDRVSKMSFSDTLLLPTLQHALRQSAASDVPPSELIRLFSKAKTLVDAERRPTYPNLNAYRSFPLENTELSS
jgi:hypothetical protein